MLKLIAILALSSTLSVAVETEKGYVERTFPNTAAGAQALIAFAEQTIGEPQGGVRVVVGSTDDELADDHIVLALANAGVPHGLVSAEDVLSVVQELKLAGPSAKAVAIADERKFGHIYRRKR